MTSSSGVGGAPVTGQEADEADYDAATARQFERREPNPSAAQWGPGEFNECTCRACHVTSTFGGMRVITDPNVPHGHPGVILHSEDDLTDADQCDGRTERQTDE